MSSTPPLSETMLAAAAAQVPAALADLGALVRVRSIAFSGFDRAEVRRSAEAVAELARGVGVFEDVAILDAGIPGTDERGMPAVVAVRAARAGRPTILLYAHHDVQPVGDEDAWETPPFEPTVIDGRLYGRGAADDKAGIMVHLGALRALAEVAGDDLDLGVVLFVEGEEEAGSRSFGAFIADHAERLRADVIVVADSGNWDTATPALTTSLRGNARFTVRVRTLAHASHSGMFGGAVPDATMTIITMLATLWDADGSVAVPGLAVRAAETPPYPEQTLREEAGLLAGTEPIGDGEILGRIWNSPAITVTGLDVPTLQHASNTLLPEAAAVVSVRVAPGQRASEAYEAVRAHLLAHTPWGAEVSFQDVDLGDGFLVDTDGWAVGEARAALGAGYGVEPVEIGVGGSIPFIAQLVEQFPAAQILVTGVEDPHSRAHSPNESLHLDTFRHALSAEAVLLGALNGRAG